MPSYQGALDGLCGQYAVANALELCGLGKHHRALFEIACAAAPVQRWPVLLWKGTTFGDLKRMVRNCLHSPANRIGVEATFPFSRREPLTNSEYWKAFDTLFSDERAICGIVGLRAPNAHWVVVVPDGRGWIIFIDSSPDKPVYRKSRSALHAGSRRKRPTQWLLDRRQLVVFRR